MHVVSLEYMSIMGRNTTDVLLGVSDAYARWDSIV